MKYQNLNTTEKLTFNALEDVFIKYKPSYYSWIKVLGVLINKYKRIITMQQKKNAL